MCSRHLHLLADKNSAFEIFFLPLSNSINFLFIAQTLFFIIITCISEGVLTLTIGPSVYPVSGQNRQEGICPPVVNQLSIYSFAGRGGAL